MRRAVASALVVWGVVTLTFVLVEAAPGSPADLVAGDHPLTAEARARLEAAFGADRSPAARYAAWLGGLLRGDLGWSIAYGRPVSGMLAGALPATLGLAAAALAVQIGLGLALGTLHVAKPGTALDHALSAAGLTIASVPTFWLGMIAILAFAFLWPLFPPSSSHSIDAASWPAWRRATDVLWHAVLPAAVLGTGAAAALARYVRAGLLEALGENFVRAARARGAGSARVVVRHALRSSLGPVITLAGLSFPALVSGSLVVEVVFGWPGMGRLAYDAVRARDLPVVLGTVLVSTLVVLAGSLAADLGLAIADPRARAAAERG